MIMCQLPRFIQKVEHAMTMLATVPDNIFVSVKQNTLTLNLIESCRACTV
jgi:hypothetical protein